MIKDIKLFVETPNILGFSHGSLCLRDLIKVLENQKIKIFKITKNNSIKNKIKQNLNIYEDQYIINYFKSKSSKGDWFLACDTTSPYLLDIARKNNLKIIWWQLAPYNFLGSNQIPRPGEYSLPFSSFTDPYAKNYFYYQAKVDKIWEDALKKKKLIKKKSHKICLYNGKGRICNLGKDIKNLFTDYKINIITRLTPKDRTDYFKLLIESDGLISFDQMTQTNLEAASLGLPVLIANPLFPEICLEKFNIKRLKSRITTSSREFINWINNNEKDFIPFEKNYLESHNNTTLKNIIEIIKGRKEIKPLSEKDIKNFKKYTNFLKSQKVIFPLVNSGQSPSSLLIDLYKKNLINKRKYPYLYLLLPLIDSCGHLLYKLGLIRIIEVLIIKLMSFLKN